MIDRRSSSLCLCMCVCVRSLARRGAGREADPGHAGRPRPCHRRAAREAPGALPPSPSRAGASWLARLSRGGAIPPEAPKRPSFRSPLASTPPIPRLLLPDFLRLWFASLFRFLPCARQRHTRTVRVPPGHVWLQGDNVTASRDSRLYGPVPLGLVKYRVAYRVRWRPSALAGEEMGSRNQEPGRANSCGNREAPCRRV